MEHTPRVLAVIIMDADGNRLVAKYYPVAAGGRTFQAGGETAYEKKLFRKTKHNHAAAVDSDARPPGVATTRETGARRGDAAESACSCAGHARGRELVDQGKILEVEPKTIANRVLMRGVDGTTTITDMSIRTP
ncbi:hypothetical protein JL722_14357 [Aureococcus anophagefferens]|nr:hypothetical protein JL722_14357 [Aureococcus anophagefferens]